TLVRYAAEQQIPLTARGAASGSAGEALGPGIIVDFARHFRSILNVSDGTITTQPGVVVQRLNDRLAAIGPRGVPPPENPAICTIGGVVAVNGSGLRVAHHGYPGDRLLSGRMVMDSGDVVDFRRQPITASEDGTARWNEVHAGVQRLLRTYSAAIAAEQ